MGVTRLKKWDITAIEIALDLELPHVVDTRFTFSGPAEPRICVVAGFALTSQLKHIFAAVDRVVPGRAISGLLISPAIGRSLTSSMPVVAIQPMFELLRLQSKLIRAIEPGLASGAVPQRVRRAMGNTAAQFIANFISHKSLPTFEPPRVPSDFETTELRIVGLTIYRLGDGGSPESILSHWTYA